MTSILAYPPHDQILSDFFVRRAEETDDELRIKYSRFLWALFTCAHKYLEIALDKKREGSIAKRWADYLAADATTKHVGPNRRAFYEEVTQLATRVRFPLN